MSVVLHVVYGQSCYTEYVTILTFRYPSFLAVTRSGSISISIRIRCLVTVYFHVRQGERGNKQVRRDRAKCYQEPKKVRLILKKGTEK